MTEGNAKRTEKVLNETATQHQEWEKVAKQYGCTNLWMAYTVGLRLGLIDADGNTDWTAMRRELKEFFGPVQTMMDVIREEAGRGTVRVDATTTTMSGAIRDAGKRKAGPGGRIG